MEHLSIEQIAYYQSELELKKQRDHTFLLLSESANGLYKELLIRSSKKLIRAYAEALRVLTIHNEYLAYQIGLQHGKQDVV